MTAFIAKTLSVDAGVIGFPTAARAEIILRRSTVDDSFVIIPSDFRRVVALSGGNGTTLLIPNTNGSIYEVTVYDQSGGKLAQFFFMMPDANSVLSQIAKTTSFPIFDWDDKEPKIAFGNEDQYWAGNKTWKYFSKALVGLGNVDNTSDLSKPISTAVAAEFNTVNQTLNNLPDANVKVLQPFTGAITRTQHDKNLEFISVKDFGAIGDGTLHTVQEWYTIGATYYRGYANLAAVQAQYPHVTGASYLVDQAAIEAASIALAAGGGGTLIFPRGKYFYRRLTIRSGVIWRGAGSQCTMLTCVDSSTLDSGVTFGSSIRKADDGTRAFRAGFYGLSFWTGAAGTGSNQTTYQNVAAINLCGCERTTLEDVGFGGFGYGALILARAEAGAEGLGFVNTTHDGNYNTFFNLSFGSCGRFNPDKAVIWLKYKANSNKFYSLFAKGCTDAYLMIIPNGNDNAIFGGTLESCAGVANIGSGTIAATGNIISGVRVEGASMDAYVLGALAENNFILGGYHTGVVGQDFNMINKNNRILSDATNHLRSKPFPPPTSYSTLHNLGALRVTALNGDVNNPLYIKAETFNDPLNYPKSVFYSDVTNGVVGNVLGRVGWHNSDTSSGAAGESAAIEAVLEDSAGATGLSFLTGTGTTLSEKLRIRSNGAQDFVVPTATLALTKNGTMNFRLASDTSLEIRVRGSDGVTRSVALTLA